MQVTAVKFESRWRRLAVILSASLLLGTLGAGCDDVYLANNDSEEPFPRDVHSLLPPEDGERVAVSHFPIPVDEQPIAFNHSVHALPVEEGGMGMDCQYCHYTSRVSKHAGVPPTQVCMGCHSWIDDTDKPSLTYLKTYWEEEEPIAWTKVHDLPDFAYFNHSIHVQPGKNKDGVESTQRVACQECHGEMQERTVAVREASLEMGWCLNCHENHESIDHNYKDKAQVRRAEIKDCWTCHN